MIIGGVMETHPMDLPTAPQQRPEPEELRLDSATLARLMEEVRNEDASVARSYDRSHNRHNR
jgi:hypothetical protein